MEPSKSMRDSDPFEDGLSTVNDGSRLYHVYHTMWHYDYTVTAADKRPLYYVDNSSFTPKKPDLTFHAGPDKIGPVVGVCKFLHFSRHVKLGLGDPQIVNSVEWEDLICQSYMQNKYRWQMTVPGINGMERRSFIWKRTHSVAVEGSSATMFSSRNFKLVDEQTGQIVAVFTSNAFKSMKKSGKLQITPNYGQQFDLMVLLTGLSLSSGGGGGGGGGASMALRKPHRKSRHGCLECKRRRVKCDESRPVCSNCAKRLSECEYESSSSLLWANEELNRAKSARSGSEASQPPDVTCEMTDTSGPFSQPDSVSSHSTLNLSDLELMMQWCNSTYQVLTRNDKTDVIWRFRVPEEALSYPCLMHGILALSAIQIARTRDDHQRSSYLNAAVTHQSQALASFREKLNDINDANAKAMFALSSVVVVYAFGYPRALNWDDPWMCIDELVQILVLSRGVQQVLNQATPAIRDSDWCILLRLDEYFASLPRDDLSALERLRELNTYCSTRNSTHDTDTYSIAIDYLMDMTAAGYGGLSSITVAARWAIKLKPPFVVHVRERDPLALVILAHFCALLHRLRYDWCVDQWIFRLPKAIWQVLDEYWRPYVQWAMIEVFGEDFLVENGRD
ncbi:C6 zinc finger domain protein [Aspergillus avenaceus]|uniref:C6 zinc finger domain protein n=1 Tax=Aspergillus avenaceus TaxID=36643 RepID=A0A5N6TK66_ASPAV|nr:C6 zinc finger domain protein [Aspergillus avenaceus]